MLAKNKQCNRPTLQSLRTPRTKRYHRKLLWSWMQLQHMFLPLFFQQFLKYNEHCYGFCKSTYTWQQNDNTCCFVQQCCLISATGQQANPSCSLVAFIFKDRLLLLWHVTCTHIPLHPRLRSSKHNWQT